MPILPAVTALQNAQNLAVAMYARLRPLIFGPKGIPHRYLNASEKIGILEGPYQSAVGTTYAFPGILPTSLVDAPYTKVWCENALLNYFNDYIGSGSVVAPVANNPNQIRAATDVFQTANDVSRSAALYDRDVQVGDIVYVRGTNTSVVYDLWTSVTGLLPDLSAAVVADATADANNKATQSESASISQVSGTPINDLSATANGTAYKSLADGYITRTYTITVTQGSTGGDATTALLSVVAADGLDNQTNVTPAAFSAPTAIGTKGLTVTWTDTHDAVSASAGVAPDDFVVGQQWTVLVKQAFTAPSATSGGTYAGASTTTYIIKVSRGGLFADATPPQLTVTATTGVDSSGPTSVTAASTPVAVGTQGVTVSFSDTGLCSGDVYYILATAAIPGAVRTLVLKNNLPTPLQTATDLDLRLAIQLPVLQVPTTQLLPTPTTNWTQTSTGVTVNAGLQATTSGLTNSGAPVYVPVINGLGSVNALAGASAIYLEYREWDTTLAGTIFSLNTRAQVPSVLGIVDPDNPIAYAVDCALQNTASANLSNPNTSASTSTDIVKCAVVSADPTQTASWETVLGLISDVDSVYTLVPLTTLPAVLSLVASHVVAQSTPQSPNYRCALLQGTVTTPVAIVTAANTTDGAVPLGTIAVNPAQSGSYTYFSVPSNDALFITHGVLPGDTVRYQYSVDAFGNSTYVSYTVGSIVSESTLLLTAGPSGPVSTPQRFEIWRNASTAQQVAQLEAQAASYGSTRVCLVWPDTAVDNNGNTVAGYNVCAALAGLMGSVPSHQGLRNVQLLGFQAVPRSAGYFTTLQLDTLGSNGVMVVSLDPTSGLVYVRWAVTTNAGNGATFTEEMYRRNTDFFVLALLNDIWGIYIGSANITSFLLATLRSAFNGLVNRLATRTYTASLGSAVLSNGTSITSLSNSPTQSDQIVATIAFSGPYPDNANVLTVNI